MLRLQEEQKILGCGPDDPAPPPSKSAKYLPSVEEYAREFMGVSSVELRREALAAMNRVEWVAARSTNLKGEFARRLRESARTLCALVQSALESSESPAREGLEVRADLSALRGELEAMKAENAVLRGRIKDLERRTPPPAHGAEVDKVGGAVDMVSLADTVARIVDEKLSAYTARLKGSASSPSARTVAVTTPTPASGGDAAAGGVTGKKKKKKKKKAEASTPPAAGTSSSKKEIADERAGAPRSESLRSGREGREGRYNTRGWSLSRPHSREEAVPSRVASPAPSEHDYDTDVSWSSLRAAGSGPSRKRGRPPTTGEYVGLQAAKEKLLQTEVKMLRLQEEQKILGCGPDDPAPPPSKSAKYLPSVEEYAREFMGVSSVELRREALAAMNRVEWVAARSTNLKGEFARRLRESARTLCALVQSALESSESPAREGLEVRADLSALRGELEAMKAENAVLRGRIKDLERRTPPPAHGAEVDKVGGAVDMVSLADTVARIVDEKLSAYTARLKGSASSPSARTVAVTTPTPASGGDAAAGGVTGKKKKKKKKKAEASTPPAAGTSSSKKEVVRRRSVSGRRVTVEAPKVQTACQSSGPTET
ncbi:unnamed protein product [Xylocopa violacea]|uniref:Uncharacterized protein n=1 Tax=Xylocopa violacea TaxID=135666 RepID=A0ABP1MXF0_XYLVO